VNATRGVPEPSPSIGESAFIGLGAVIIGGVVIGDGAYVAAGSVVTKDASPGRLYMGAPARECGPAPNAFAGDEGRTLRAMTNVVSEMSS
jgi:acetyltransferase-like isoleucine patch superfamily enzyme